MPGVSQPPLGASSARQPGATDRGEPGGQDHVVFQAGGDGLPGTEREPVAIGAPPSERPSSRLRSTARALRRSRLEAVILLLIGVVVFMPSLTTPFLLDDYLHVSMLEGTFPAKRSAFDLYDFINDTDRPVLVARGLLPWWSHPHLQVRFFRPLASALRWADHQAFGTRPLPLHLHSLAWWVLAVLAARRLFRRALSPRAARIALIAFALAPCHALPLGWLANREALISLALGTVALGAHLRWREGGGLRWAVLGAAGFSASLLAGEYGLGFAGYVLAREIVERGRPLVRRALGLATFALPAAGYLLVRALLGYGSYGSGFYADPFSETATFLREVPRRLGTLLVEGWFSLDNDTLTAATPGWLLALVVALAAALLYLPLRRAYRALDAGRRSMVAWLSLGSVLALPPMVAVMPSPRLLGASMLGVAVAVGMLLDHAWFGAPAPAPERRGARELAGLAALALGFAHLVHAPVTSWLVGQSFRETAASFREHVEELRARLGDMRDAEIGVLRAFGSSFFLPFALDERGKPPLRWRILAQTGHALVLARDAHTLDIVVPEDAALFPPGVGNLFLPASSRLAAGTVIHVPGMRVTILEVGREGPRAARFRLDRRLDASSLVWLTEGRAGFAQAELPQIGFGLPFDP